MSKVNEPWLHVAAALIESGFKGSLLTNQKGDYWSVLRAESRRGVCIGPNSCTFLPQEPHLSISLSSLPVERVANGTCHAQPDDKP